MSNKVKALLGIVAVIFIGLAAFFYIALNTTTTVHIEHTLNAPVEKVWTIWNDPESIKKWWGPDGYSAPDVKNDLQIGGTLLLGMTGPDGKTAWNVGKYTEIIPNQKIALNLSFADEAGNSVPASHYGIPGKWPDITTVTVEFQSQGEKTHVKITETGIPLIMSLFAKMGWQQQFDKIDRLF